MIRSTALIITVLLATITGCTDPSPLTPTEFCTEYIETVCRTVERCGGKYSACEKQLTGELNCTGWTEENFCDSTIGAYNPNEATKCLDSIDQLSCQDDGSTDVCEFKAPCTGP